VTDTARPERAAATALRPEAAQPGYAYRFEWGPYGLRALAPVADVLVVVDVLSFTTCVEVAVSRGAVVLPYRFDDDGQAAYAAAHGAMLAGRRGEVGALSLSPASLQSLSAGSRVVLPSPNGSALAFAAAEAGAKVVLAGCLRNASAVADAARSLAGPGGVVAVLAAGERWRGDTGPMRPAVEDLLGAGAILAALDPAASLSVPCCSPEAGAARASFVAARPRLAEVLAGCQSGRELIERGYPQDVVLAAQLDISRTVPVLRGNAFVSA
jgi:2-phosphosulfolactate phosphatase